MQLSRGVEWAVHCCTLMAILPPDRGLSADDMAGFFEVPAAYLAKQMQALRRAGIAQSVRGQGGGYRLSKPVDEITLWDIVAAIEGKGPAFRCTEIRQNGPCAMRRAECRTPCEIASAFAEAEAAWRNALAARTLADINRDAAGNLSPEHLIGVARWVMDHA